MKKSTFSAVSLRKLLIVVIVLLIGAVGAGFYFGMQTIRQYAVDVSHTVADSQASEGVVDDFKKLQQTLAERESLIDKANKLFSTEASYQSQALTDVKKYASDNGLTVSNTNFDVAQDPALGTGRTFEVSLQSPVPYMNLLRFLDAVEGNLPKMQIDSITIGRQAANSNQVTVEGVTVRISTR